MGFELREWSIIGGVSLALFGLYSYNHSASNSKPLYEVPESYEMIRPTEVSNYLDLSGRTVIHKTNKKLDARVPQKSNTPVAKAEDPKKAAADKKKKEEEAKKKAQALKDAQKKKLEVKVVGESNKSTFDEGFDKANKAQNQHPLYVSNWEEAKPAVDDADPIKKEKPKKTIGEWEKEFFGATFDNKSIGNLISARKNGEISEAEFSNLVWKLLHDQSRAGEKKTIALQILRADMSYASFVVAVKYYKETSDPEIKTVVDSFKSRVPVLVSGLGSRDADVRAKSLEFADALVAGFNVGSQGAQTPRSPANVTLASLFQLVLPLDALAKNPDPSIAERALDLSQRIRSLKS